MNPPSELFPPIDPYRHGMLETDSLHRLYYEESGNPEGIPVLCVHGGPGSSSSPIHRRFFDPSVYRICQIDQRGCGRSEPHGETRSNTTPDLVADMETLRLHLGVDAWLLFAGSWGATLALVYAGENTEVCLGVILRGSFLSSEADLQWFLVDAGKLRPEAWSAFTAHVGEHEKDALLRAYHQRFESADTAVAAAATAAWIAWENTLDNPLNGSSKSNSASATEQSVRKYRLQTSYLLRQCDLNDNSVIDAAGKLGKLPIAIVHGQLDWVCRPDNAWKLHLATPGSTMVWIEGSGHNPFSHGMTVALTTATMCFAKDRNFDQLQNELVRAK